jgi:hypothetical protein
MFKSRKGKFLYELVAQDYKHKKCYVFFVCDRMVLISIYLTNNVNNVNSDSYVENQDIIVKSRAQTITGSADLPPFIYYAWMNHEPLTDGKYQHRSKHMIQYVVPIKYEKKKPITLEDCKGYLMEIML